MSSIYVNDTNRLKDRWIPKELCFATIPDAAECGTIIHMDSSEEEQDVIETL